MILKPLRFVNKRQNLILNYPKSGSYRSKSDFTKETGRNRTWKVMFFGTDEFSLGSLTRLNDELKFGKTLSKLEVVSSKWHSNPVKLFSQRENLFVHEWPIQTHVVQDFDIGFVASFGHLIPKSLIDAFPFGLLNVHGSLLPRWRGAAPVNYAILNGDSVTGISIMRVRPHAFDKGEVLSQRKVVISPTETALQLRARLSEVGGEELIACLRTLPQCLDGALPQAQEGVCYAPKISTDMGFIDFKKMTANDIYNRYRALHEFIPLTAMWMGLKLTLHDVSLGERIQSRLSDNENNSTRTCIPGQVLFDKKSHHLRIQCKHSSQVIVGRIAPYKKKPLKAIEFYNGYLSKKGKESWIFQ